MGDDLIGYAEMAEITGNRPATLRGLRARGILPPPDVMLADRPRWHRATITTWLDSRPGRGARTDLRKAEDTT